MCKTSPYEPPHAATTATPSRVASSSSFDSTSTATAASPPKTVARNIEGEGKKNSTAVVLDYLQFTIACILPFYIPPGSVFAEGFTRWWLRMTLFYLLYGYRYTNLAKFQATLGLTINVGWYLVSTHDWLWNGRQFGNIVYRNVRGIRNITIVGSWTAETLEFATGNRALGYRILSMTLDTLLHPVVCYCFWRVCRRKYGCSLDQVATWTNLMLAFGASRTWSICQNYKHYGTLGLYYKGPHVYYLPSNRDQIYMIGYVGETICITSIVLYKLYCKARRQRRCMEKRSANKAV